MSKVAALVRTWLLLDFFGEARRAGKGQASSLTTTIFTQSFLAFVFAALLYPETPPVAFAAANLCLSTLLVAIGALGDESRPERRAADDLLLRTAPIGTLAVAMARSGHAAFAILLVTIGMALPPAILLAFLRHEAWLAGGYLLGACACSALAGGALGVCARLTTRWLGAGRTALLMGSLKAMLLGGGLVLFALCLPRLQGTAADLPLGSTGALLLPPYQVARWLAAPAAEAWRWLPLLAAGGALLALALLAGGPATAPRLRVQRQSPAMRLLRRLTTPGPHRAIAEFVAIGMWRSAGFRARVLPLLGVPAAMVLLAARHGEGRDHFVLTSVLMQLPAIYLPFLVAFLPRADQPGANWVFAHAPELTRGVVHDAVWRAMVTHVLLPVFGLALLLTGALRAEGLAALPALCFAAGVAVLAAKPAARALQVVPFTEAREGDAGPELGGTFAPALLLGGLGAAYGLGLPEAWRWPVAALACAAAALLLLRPGGEAAGEPIGAGQTPAGADGEQAEPRARTTDPRSGPAKAPATLRGELRAIVVLYAILCLLPCAVGTMFAV